VNVTEFATATIRFIVTVAIVVSQNLITVVYQMHTVIVAFTFAIDLWYYHYHKVTSSNRLRPSRSCPNHASTG